MNNIFEKYNWRSHLLTLNNEFNIIIGERSNGRRYALTQYLNWKKEKEHMNLYEFISKFIQTDLVIYHHVPNDVRRQIYKGDTNDFISRFPREHILSKVTTFAVYINKSNELVINYIYNSDNIENKLKEGK